MPTDEQIQSYTEQENHLEEQYFQHMSEAITPRSLFQQQDSSPTFRNEKLQQHNLLVKTFVINQNDFQEHAHKMDLLDLENAIMFKDEKLNDGILNSEKLKLFENNLKPSVE